MLCENVDNIEDSLPQIKQNQFLEDFFWAIALESQSITRCCDFYTNEGH